MVMGKGKKSADERCGIAVSGGFTKAMPPSFVTGVAFVALEPRRLDKQGLDVREAVKGT